MSSHRGADLRALSPLWVLKHRESQHVHPFLQAEVSEGGPVISSQLWGGHLDCPTCWKLVEEGAPAFRVVSGVQL